MSVLTDRMDTMSLRVDNIQVDTKMLGLKYDNVHKQLMALQNDINTHPHEEDRINQWEEVVMKLRKELEGGRKHQLSHHWPQEDMWLQQWKNWRLEERQNEEICKYFMTHLSDILLIVL